MKRFFQKLKQVLGLSLAIAKAEFKLRNEGSYLGILWYLLNPLLMFGLLLLIFSTRLGTDIPSYPIYLLLGIVMFNFFQSSTIESTKSIIKEDAGIIKSINFQKESLIFAIILKSLFSHFFEILLFAILLIVFKINLVLILAYLPMLVLLSFFTLGVSLILSSLTVYFVDLENIWNFAVRLIWFGTPIFYAIEGQTRLFYLNLFNPMFYFITTAREIIIYSNLPQIWLILGCVFYSLLFLFAGLILFNKLKNKFAEMI